MSYAAALRRELSQRNIAFAKKNALLHSESYGAVPAVAYPPNAESNSHGNFHRSSYQAIMQCAGWSCRFDKVHSQKKSLPAAEHGRWKELDSCNSSDALLMNVLCYPRVLESSHLRALLNLHDDVVPEYGVKARVPIKEGKFDRTEVDMRLGNLLVEAKLTESGFQTKRAELIQRYRDLRKVFDVKLLPRSGKDFKSYQLIRNVLAAYATQQRFCVILDQRRPDLIEQWHSVQRAVKLADMRVRCLVLTWQELATALPEPLQVFLAEKYGIAPR
jgi:hypothetical protein